MSSINFRLYGDQIYGLAITKLKNIITPEIPKEEFLTKFKEGKIESSNIKNINKITPNPLMSIDNLQIQNIIMNIPNETENFSLDMEGIKMELELFDLKDEDAQKLLIDKRKKLIDKFIEYAVKIIENKESSKSFIEGLIENLINRALNGLKINISDIEIKIKYKNIFFTLKIEKIEYSEENGLHINNISISHKNLDIKDIEDYIIEKFSLDLNIENKKEEEKEGEGYNIINIKMSNFEFKLNKNILIAFDEIINLIKDTKYKFTYIRNKNLINYYKPIKPTFDEKTDISEKNKYYHSLWLYAIKTIIKLQKLIGYEKLYLLELDDFIQSKISKNLIDNDNNQMNQKILLVSEYNLLKNTKEKVEKKVLDGKKGNVLANAFSFFFGGSKTEEKKELTEEEKSNLENIYNQNEIYKYLSGKNENEKLNNNPIKEKLTKFISNLKINFNFSKFEIILVNDEINKCKLFIEGINLEIMKKLEQINIQINIKDIGSNLGENLFGDRKKLNDNNDLIMINISEKKKIKVDLGFNNIEFNDSILNFFIIFSSNIKLKEKTRIFKELKCKYEDKKEEKVKNENDESNELMNNFSISNIPSFTISIHENKIKFSVVDYSITKSKIGITYNIKDSFGTILDNYKFVFNRDETNHKYNLKLDLPLRMKLSSESSNSILISYIKLKERIKQIQKQNKYNSQQINISNEDELYNFNYIIHKKLDIKDFDISKIKIEIYIEKIIIEIYEKTIKTKFCIHDFNLTYENRDLLFTLEKLSIKTNIMSTLILYLMDLESPNFHFYQHYIDEIEKEYENINQNQNNELVIDQKEENINKSNIKYEFNVDYFLNKFSIYIKILNIRFQSDDNIISYCIGKINIKKEEDNILVKINNIAFIYRKEGGKSFKIINFDEETSVSINKKKNLVMVNISHPKANINLEALNNIRRSFQFLLEQIDLEIILCKADLKVFDALIKLNNEFNLSVSKISLKNYDGDKTDTLYFSINDFIIQNQKKEIIINQKSIDIKLITQSIIKYEAIIAFSDFYLNLSMDDLKNILFILKQTKERKFKLISKNTKHYIKKPETIKRSHEVHFTIKIKLPLFSFSLKDNSKNKKFEIILSDLENILNFYVPEEKVKDIKKNIKLNLGRINIIAYQCNGIEYNILEFKENMNNNFKENNLINFEQKINNTKNQLELILNNENDDNIDDITINLNKFGINLRIDIFHQLLLIIKEISSLKRKEEEEMVDEKEHLKNLRINFSQFELKLDSIDNENEFICFNINKFIFNSLPEEVQEIKIDKFSISFVENEEISNIFQNPNKNDFIIINIYKKNLLYKINTEIDEANIYMTFTDVKLLKEFINKNYKYYEKYKINSLFRNDKEEENMKNIKEHNSKPYELKLNMKKIEMTLIDDYLNNSFPFLNLDILDINCDSTEQKELKSSFLLIISTYNYISSSWEPFIENTPIKVLIYKKEENNLKIISFNMEISNILVNISDMFIASTLLSIKNFNNIFKENIVKNINNNKISDKKTTSTISYSINSELEGLENEFNIFSIKEPQTNNNLINYTGVDFKFKYGNKFFESENSIEKNLVNDNKRDNKKLIQIYYDKNNIINIPLFELGHNIYKFDNNNYLVWENIITKHRQINIILYSPYIFKNKTNLTYQIKLINPKLVNTFFLLKPNSCSGIPLSFCNNETLFSIKIIKTEDKNLNESKTIRLKDIINIPNNIIKINMKNSSLILKCQQKIENVNTILLTNEYKIINCLPCDLFIHTNDIINRKIKKCSQFLLDFPNENSDIRLGIKVNTFDIFYCNVNLRQLFEINRKNEYKKYLRFVNQYGQSFNLAYILKDKESYKGLIIFSDYILFNDSGIDFNLEANILFNIAKNIYIISNNINLNDESITLSSNYFNYSQNIGLYEMVKASPYYQIYLNNGLDNIILPLTKKISSIPIKNNPNFKSNVFSMIFYILPSCKITNLFMNKKLIIRNLENEKESIVIPPLNQVSFNFFNKNKNNLYLELSLIDANETKCKKINILNTLKTGIYTFYSTDVFYNVEIKDSSSEGNLNIFIAEANLNTSKILVINKTLLNFEIYQKKYEKYKQEFKENETKILNIHDQINTQFIAEINGKEYEIGFIPFIEEFQTIEIDNDYLLVKESNGVKMKILLYNKNEFYKMYQYDKIININLLISNCFISIIEDNYNKNKSLKNYKREELLLFYINNLNPRVNIKQYNSTVNKKNINIDVILNKFEIYNQLSKKGKYACIFKNLDKPFINLNQNIDLYSTDKIAKINNFKLLLTKQKIYIETEFILELIDFIANIKYRLGEINMNVDKIFLRTDKNIRDITLKNNFQKYKISQKLICFGFNFSFPEINIDFEISESNLENFLSKKLGIPNFIIWIILGLVNQNQNIYLENEIIDNYFGDFSRLFSKAIKKYAAKTINIALGLGFKGIWGQIKNMFVDIRPNLISFDVFKNRIRYPRAFYGKYQTFKNYSEDDAKIIDIINNMYKNDFKNLYCDYLIMNKKYIFYFSGEALLILTHKFELYYKIDYNTINNVYSEKENLIIIFKQENGEDNPPSIIYCGNEEMAEKLVNYFQNEYLTKFI